MKAMCGNGRLFVIAVAMTTIFAGCAYVPKQATRSEVSNNTDQGKVFNNVKIAIRSMGLIVKEQDPDAGYISAVKGDLSPFTLQVFLMQRGQNIAVEAKTVSNYAYVSGPLSIPDDELPENVVAKFFQALKATQ